jgi:hypothetical protein
VFDYFSFAYRLGVLENSSVAPKQTPRDLGVVTQQNLMSAFARIVLKKSFWSDDQNFSGSLMRFSRGDMRDHIASHKNDHRASYERYGALQWWSRLKISFCEIFGVVQFSTFATLSLA